MPPADSFDYAITDYFFFFLFIRDADADAAGAITPPPLLRRYYAMPMSLFLINYAIRRRR